MKICYRIDLHTWESLAVTGLLLLANTLWGRMKQKKHINFNCRHLLPYTAAETQSHKLQRNPCSTFESTIGKRDTPKVAFFFLLLFYVGNQFPVRARYNLGDCCIFVFRSSLSISTLFRCAFYRQPFFLTIAGLALFFSALFICVTQLKIYCLCYAISEGHFGQKYIGAILAFIGPAMY